MNTAFDVSRIPQALRRRQSWVCWFVGYRDGKATKILLNPRTGRAAKSNDPATWSTLDAAIATATARGYGIGYVFSDADPFTGVDLDKCRDPKTGAIAAWALRIIEFFRTYSEVSPSGTGVKLVLLGKFAGRGRRRGTVEVYCRKRFFTITGDHLVDAPCEPQPRQRELDQFMVELFPEPSTAVRVVREPVSQDDEQLLERARAARNGDLFTALWAGHWQSRYDSASEADLALCALLSFWAGGDAARVDSLFRRSGLCRDKWLDRADYRGATLAKATTGEVYSAAR